MTLFWETIEGKFAKIWSIKVEMLELGIKLLELGIELVALNRALYKTDDTFHHQYMQLSYKLRYFSWTIYSLFSYIFMLKLSRIYISFVSVSIEGKFLFGISRKLFWEDDR